MLSLIVTLFGGLLSLAGLVGVAPQVRARQVNPASVSAWVFRAGILALLAGEVVALFLRPENPLVFKAMLIAGAAIAFVGLAMLSQESQQTGFALEKSFSWQVMLLGMGAFLMAVMFIQPIVMIVAAAGSYGVVRYARREFERGRLDLKTLSNGTFAGQIVLMILTALMLFA